MCSVGSGWVCPASDRVAVLPSVVVREWCPSWTVTPRLARVTRHRDRRIKTGEVRTRTWLISILFSSLSRAERKTQLGIVAFDSSDGAVIEARDRLAEQGVHADYLRLRAFPFSDEVLEFLRSHETVFVVEQNRDAQMKSLLRLEAGDAAGRLISILHYNGMPIPSDCIADRVRAHIQQEVAA